MVELFIFQCVNFLILAGGLVYFLRKPLREFLSGRMEMTRTQIVKADRDHEAAVKKHAQSEDKISRADADAEALKRSLLETGNFGRETIIAKARETADRIERETETLAAQARAHARQSLSREALAAAFEKAVKTLEGGVAKEDQKRLLNKSLSVLGGFNV